MINQNILLFGKIFFRFQLQLKSIILRFEDSKGVIRRRKSKMILIFDCWCLMPLLAIFQLNHGDQFQWRKKPEYLERTADHGQVTGKLYHLWLRVECTLFCHLQSWVLTHTVLVIGLYALLGNPTTQLIEPSEKGK